MLKGKPAGESDAVTMSAIRAVMIQHDVDGSSGAQSRAPIKARVPLRAVDPALSMNMRPVREVEAKVNLAKFTTVPQDAPQAHSGYAAPVVDERVQPVSEVSGAADAAQGDTAKRNVLSVFTPRILAIVVMFGLAMVQPGLLIFAVLGLVATPFVGFVLLGPERFWLSVSRALVRYEAQQPKRAAQVLDALDTVAVHWDNVLDRFPERWVSRLYMPDFAVHADILKAHEERVDERLARMHKQV